jgi:hypothetical protein
MKKRMPLPARLLVPLAILAVACDAPDEPQPADVHAALMAAPAASNVDPLLLKSLRRDDIEALDCRPDGWLYACSFLVHGSPYRQRLNRDAAGRWVLFGIRTNI